MKFRRSTALFVLVVSIAAGVQAQPGERDFLSRVRRLTIEGRRAGEGYWSKDGKQLVFQSEREPGNPFYQIYLMDMETGNTVRVSPGIGKTTCAFINPDTGDILFASTHHDPRSKQLQDEELKFRASGQERRYCWDYDPEMELYIRSKQTGSYRRLTNRRGYDAEASYSHDGKQIVFTSTRDGDPELYRMRVDGSGVERLTHEEGYDGGAFFSPGGTKIVYRARHPADPEELEHALRRRGPQPVPCDVFPDIAQREFDQIRRHDRSSVSISKRSDRHDRGS